MAYGIFINHISGRLSELYELISFCWEAKRSGISQYVKEISYNSSEQLATITFKIKPTYQDPIYLAVHRVARETLDKFQLFGDAYLKDGHTLIRLEDKNHVR
ncbi:hypothetical protein DESC_930027 [Desulfosarcina cetonica]|nr:hypothetical protein DESC_930027 [Desulfosarcina cetonica]